MGRPIKRKFFGVNNVADGLTYSDAGGEGLSSVTLTAAGSAYSQGLTATVAVSPIGGTTAAVSLSVYTANGAIYSPTVVTAGTGYTSAPAITLVKPANVVTTGTTYYDGGASNVITVGTTTGLYVGMTANTGFGATTQIVNIYTGNSNVVMNSTNTSALSGAAISFGDTGASGSLTAVLASVITTANTIQANAWVTGGTIGKQADIVSQRSSRRYRVTNADGTAVCRLVPAAPTAEGEMSITATDSDAGTYYVLKLDSRTATLVPGTGVQFSNLAQVRWTSTGSAEADTVVKLATND